MPSKTTFAMATELSVAVPLVILERFTRMALAGPVPTEREDRELTRMYFEKLHAFTDAWFGMASAMVQVHQGLASGVFFRPFHSRSYTDLHDATMHVVNSGLAPVHKAATGNALRLVRSR